MARRRNFFPTNRVIKVRRKSIQSLLQSLRISHHLLHVHPFTNYQHCHCQLQLIAQCFLLPLFFTLSNNTRQTARTTTTNTRTINKETIKATQNKTPHTSFHYPSRVLAIPEACNANLITRVQSKSVTDPLSKNYNRDARCSYRMDSQRQDTINCWAL